MILSLRVKERGIIPDFKLFLFVVQKFVSFVEMNDSSEELSIKL